MISSYEYPQLAVYDASRTAFTRLMHELDDNISAGNTLYLKESIEVKPFIDPGSTFTADTGELRHIAVLDEASVAIGLNLSYDGSPFAREIDFDVFDDPQFPFDNFLQPHVIVAGIEVPPTLLHMNHFYRPDSSVRELPALVSAGYAEILAGGRSSELIRVLGSLTTESIDHTDMSHA